MLSVLVELLIEIVGQVVFELVLEGTFRGIARLLENRVVRTVLGALLAAAVGYGGGYWWGARLTELGRTDPPTSLWVSIGLAVLFLALAAARVGARGAGSASPGVGDRLLPWRWSAPRLLGFALMNGAAAAGITVGFVPRPLP